ncbi:MAG: PD-(D/E)XK nuclease family protein [Candidatus Nanohaloarchaea archaeon]|nr:PD-(D/E)XK nuclease family protein [Candidatus Nanohaloarchaea archaeon]
MDPRRRRTIDGLYKQVSQHDLVLTTDPALTDALNARTEQARLGRLAYTPRQLIQQQRPNADLAGRRELFLAVVRETDLDWHRAAAALDDLLDCWQHTGDHDRIRDLPRHGANAGHGIDAIQDEDSIYHALARYQLPGDRDVAVIDPDGFTALDRSILPDEHTAYRTLTDEETELPELNVFASGPELVRAAMQQVEANDPDDVGIVVAPGSRYDAMLRARLESAGIPYMRQRTVGDSSELRGFLTVLRHSLADRVRLKDLLPLLLRHGIDAPVEHSEQYLDTVDDPALDGTRDLLQELPGSTVGEAAAAYGDVFSPVPDEVLDDLDDAGFLDRSVAAETVERLAFYLDAYDPGLDQDRRGVLLADPTEAMHVDRPIVLHLGLDASWNVDVRDRPWIDTEQEERWQLERFTALLQSGDTTRCLVQDRRMNEDVAPCHYLAELADTTSFREMDGQRYTAAADGGQGFAAQPMDVTTDDVSMLSTSTLDTLVHCPRDQFFSELVEQYGQPYFTKGSVLHDFAEIYAVRPDAVEEHGLDTFIDVMVDRMQPFVDEHQLPRLRTEFRLGAQNIMAFLDDHEITGDRVTGYQDADWITNDLAERFGIELESQAAEMWFQDRDLGGRGVVDLLLSRTHLLDYKSGRQKSTRHIVEHSNLDLLDDEPSFQAMLYLAYHRRQVPRRTLEFTFFHFLDNVGDVISGDADRDDVFTTITYHPWRFAEALQQDELFDELIGDVAASNDRRKTLEKLGQEAFAAFIDDHELPDCYDRDELLDTGFAEAFIQHCRDEVGDYKYVENGAEKALKRLVRLRRTNYFADDLDRFEDFLQQEIQRLNEWRRTRFPVDDADLDRTDNRDLILTGDGR